MAQADAAPANNAALQGIPASLRGPLKEVRSAWGRKMRLLWKGSTWQAILADEEWLPLSAIRCKVILGEPRRRPLQPNVHASLPPQLLWRIARQDKSGYRAQVQRVKPLVLEGLDYMFFCLGFLDLENWIFHPDVLEEDPEFVRQMLTKMMGHYRCYVELNSRFSGDGEFPAGWGPFGWPSGLMGLYRRLEPSLDTERMMALLRAGPDALYSAISIRLGNGPDRMTTLPAL